jgi:hypothetical protein
MDKLIFYDKVGIELKNIDISYIRDNCTDIYYFLQEKNDFTYCIEYIQTYIDNIKINLDIKYNIDFDKIYRLIESNRYIDLKKFYTGEINRINSLLENKNISEDNKILINKLEQIKYSFEEFNSNSGNYYII